MYRDTYLEINLNNIKENVRKTINKYNDYKYYFGVVKADCYGHGLKAVDAIIEGGCNYLAVATLDEALEVRSLYKEIPILCLGIIDVKYLNLCKENNITITISNKEYLDELLLSNVNDLKVHIKLNTGMNRLGVNNKDDFNYIYKKIIKSSLYLEGIYTHIYDANNSGSTLKQVEVFKNITSDIDLKSIPIVHIGASDTITNYKRFDFANGCRLGFIMYGFTNDNDLDLKSTFKLLSKVTQINYVDGTVGYKGAYKTNKKEYIAVICCGYADGVIRKNTGRLVYINDKRYPIVGNVCMDMLFVKVDDSVHVKDTVYLIKDNEDLKYISNYLDTIAYELLCEVSKRVPRVYIK